LTVAPESAEKAPDLLSREDFLLTAPDNALIVATAGGDMRAFSGLSARYLRRIVALAQRMTGNASDADEIAQEAFLRLWRFAPAWDPDGTATVRTWLSRVAINLCLDLRRKKAFVALEEAGELVDQAKGGFEEASDQGKRRFINALLQELPERQRVAVILSYFEDMKGQEVAEAMDLSVKAVESLLVRARRALRDKLADKGLMQSGDL